MQVFQMFPTILSKTARASMRSVCDTLCSCKKPFFCEKEKISVKVDKNLIRLNAVADLYELTECVAWISFSGFVAGYIGPAD